MDSVIFSSVGKSYKPGQLGAPTGAPAEGSPQRVCGLSDRCVERFAVDATLRLEAQVIRVYDP